MFASQAYAQTPAAAPATGSGGIADFMSGGSGSLFLMVVMFVGFYFLLIRPQQQRIKKHREMVMAVKRGDTVVLSSGVIGKVTKVDEAEVTAEIASGVNVKVVKSMISDVRTRGAPAAANDTKS